MKFLPDIAPDAKPWDDYFIFPEDISPGSDEHDAAHLRLFELARELPSDFEPYGERVAGGWNSKDCSAGCRHYAVLDGVLGQDWGVCMNKQSPRAGLLTFEHQGCPKFERGPERESPGRIVMEGGPLTKPARKRKSRRTRQ